MIGSAVSKITNWSHSFIEIKANILTDIAWVKLKTSGGVDDVEWVRTTIYLLLIYMQQISKNLSF